MRESEKGYKLAWFVAVIAVLALGGVIAYKHFTKVTPLFAEMDAELGSLSITSDVNDYIDAYDFMKKKAVIDTSGVKLNAVGDYPVYCYVGKETIEYTVHVKDTTSPTLSFVTGKLYGTMNTYDIGSFASAKDLSEITSFHFVSCLDAKRNALHVEEQSIEVEKAGDYYVTFAAIDCYGNKSQKEQMIHFQEAPHFEFLAERIIKQGEDFEATDFVVALDQYGNNLTDQIVCHEDGFSTDKTGSYDVLFTVTDADGISYEESVRMFVTKDKKHSDYGFNLGKNIDTLKKYGYFQYDTLEKADAEKIGELTKHTSVGLKSDRVIGSGYVYKMTKDKCYFITAAHCKDILADSRVHIVRYDGVDQVIPSSDIKKIKHEKSDILMFSVPTSDFDDDFLALLEEVHIDYDVYNNMKAGDAVILNTQEHGFLGSKWKDIINVGKLIGVSESKQAGFDLGDSFFGTTSISRPGCSGGPIFDAFGDLVGTVKGRSVYINETLGLNIRIDRIQDLEKRLSEL